jgi:hypothetical protein
MIIVAGFCFGHLIHSGLMLGYQIVYLRAEGQEFYDCASIATLLLDVLYPVYSFLQLFFIFKYSNVSSSIDPAMSQNARKSLNIITNVLLFFKYALQPLRLIVRSWLDVPTFAARRLHARAPSGGRWNCGREMSDNLA